LGLGEGTVSAALVDWRGADLDPKVRAMLGFLEKMNLAPERLGPDDAAAVRAAGVSESAIDDAIHISAAFNIIVRLADAFEFERETPEALAASAKSLVTRGYR
jgi:alkylhydroperoxidase family enzyme